ncbi:family 10 glycosylhydrolase [Pleurocapsales cyanobacterium LEGE 10410]|nr:family 10 glycosylhydrolase [Pleurocapsales cyanobacterium LEGE 10410]
MSEQNKNKGCGCANVPISVILLFLGGGFWWFKKNGLPDINIGQINDLLAKIPGIEIQIPVNEPAPPPAPPTPTPTLPAGSITASPELPPTPESQKLEDRVEPLLETDWEKKKLRGIYLSRYQITNHASEQMIRDRVRYYKAQGFNTIIHGVWGNACTMYNSEVMQQTLGYKSCPNLFRDRWLDWLIDEAHQQGMEVHAYFEKGIKIDKNSPVFDRAIANKWIIPGVDRTYAGVDHYLLDVEHPEVAKFFRDILTEFVQIYPEIDAVQWDDYLGYHAELPGKVDRTESLTKFVQGMIESMKQANPNVSFDLCHHNPYWAKRYFAADWKNWDVDRVFIQNYNEKNFEAELDYIKKYDGIAITDKQFHRLPEIIDNKKIESVLIFALSGKPEETAAEVKSLTKREK